MKVNQISANNQSQNFGAIRIRASKEGAELIKKNVLPLLEKEPVVGITDKMGLDLIVGDNTLAVAPKGFTNKCKFVDINFPITNRNGALEKKLKYLPKKIMNISARMLGGSKDYIDAVLNGTLNLP